MLEKYTRKRINSKIDEYKAERDSIEIAIKSLMLDRTKSNIVDILYKRLCIVKQRLNYYIYRKNKLDYKSSKKSLTN